MSVTIDPRRTVKAIPIDVSHSPGYGDIGEPGQTGKLYGYLLCFACPGCGRFGSIGCSNPKQQHTWLIASGSLDDVTTLTLSPSINCVGCCGWHGHLQGGLFKSV